MKALVYTGTQAMAYRDEPEPELPANHSLVRIEASGICGSDMHAWHGLDERRVPPLILGHEAAGTVVQGRHNGKRVAINPLIACGRCIDCLSGRTNLCASRELIGMRLAGAFADYVSITDDNLIEVPDHADINAAALMEPTAVSLHTIALIERLRHRPVSEAQVLIIGGGAIGLLAALLLAQKGVSRCTLAETNNLRRNVVSQTGCCSVIDPLGPQKPDDNSFDVVIDAVGSGITRAESCRVVRPGGIIGHIGLQDNNAGLDTRKLTLQEILFIGTYTYTVADLHAALSLLADAQLGDLAWLQNVPLSEGADAFQAIHDGSMASPKVILHPTPA